MPAILFIILKSRPCKVNAEIHGRAILGNIFFVIFSLPLKHLRSVIYMTNVAVISYGGPSCRRVSWQNSPTLGYVVRYLDVVELAIDNLDLIIDMI